MTGFDSKRQMAQAKLEPTQWRDMVVVTLVREGIDKHRARELADHFAAQPEQEPVAKVVSTAPDKIWLDLGFDPQDETEVLFDELHDVTWSGDNASGHGIEYVRTTPPAAQPEQEPVAFYHPHKGFYWAKPTSIFAPTVVDVPPVPLYVKWIAAQRPWVGLTDEEKKTLATAAGCTEDDDGHIVTEIFRLAEIKLKEKNT